MTYATVRTPSGPMLEGSSPDLLRKLLENLFDALESAGVPLRAHLRPGLSEGYIRERLERRGLVAPLELVSWYETFDGARFMVGEAPTRLFPVFDLHSLDQALALYDAEAEALRMGSEPWEWNPEWLRIGEPVHSLAVHCAPDESAPPRVRSVGDDHTTQALDPTYQVVSLCTPVAWWIEALEAGVFEWRADVGNWALTQIFPGSRWFPQRLAGFV